VRTNGSVSNFTTLAPRQPLTPAPYALYAPSAGAAATATMAVSVNSVAAGNVTGTLGLSQLTALELQYMGNGQFMPLGYVGTIFAY
jgi:hypothetical protein